MPSPAPLPPGPSSALWMTLRFLRRPMETLEDLRRRHGDLFTVPTFQGQLVVSAHPDGARAMFGAEPDALESVAGETFGELIGKDSVLAQSGAAHRASRKLLMPPFHGERMRAYGRTMADIAQRRASAWRPGQPFFIRDTGRDISLDVIVQAVIGVAEEDRQAKVHRATVELLGSITPAMAALRPLQRLGRFGPLRRFDEAKKRFVALILEEVGRRRAAEHPSDDILSLMLAARFDDGSALGDAAIVEQILTLLIAGHETTATSIAWAMYFLHREPAVMERLREELRAVPDGKSAGKPGPDPDALAASRYLEAVCQETLRIRPLVPVVSRRVARPFAFLGHELQPGTNVGVASSLIHTRPELYPEPEAFRPERFLERSYNAFEYSPFGGGARRCLGAAFASYEMKIVLGTLLREHRLELLEQAPEVRLLLGVVGPSTGIAMRLLPA